MARKKGGRVLLETKPLEGRERILGSGPEYLGPPSESGKRSGSGYARTEVLGPKKKKKGSDPKGAQGRWEGPVGGPELYNG